MNHDWQNNTKENQRWDLAFLGALKVSGKDAKKLLQGQLTCDLEKITATQSSMGAFCNPQGRIISLFYLGQYHESYYLIMPKTMLLLTQAALKKFAVFYKVEISPASDDIKIFGYLGETSHIKDTLIIPVTKQAQRYIILADKTVAQELAQQLENHSEIAPENNWRNKNLLEKIPQIYPDTSGKILPHEIDLQLFGAIDFDKGCYTGQEIIARMHYRGKLKNHLYLAEVDGTNIPAPGSVVNKKTPTLSPCGTVIDACQMQGRNSLVLFVSDIDSVQNAALFIDNQLLKAH